MNLPDFFREYGDRPWVWGEVDCCLALADWLVAQGRADSAASLRGTYHSEDALRAILQAAGGVLPLVRQCADRAGLAETDRPAEGCVAVIGSRENGLRQWGAIFDGARWQVRLLNGFVAVTARPIQMWGV